MRCVCGRFRFPLSACAAECIRTTDLTLTEGVTEIAWSGGELPDEYYDEFVFRGRLTGFEPGTVLSFPIVQECTQGVHRWIEIPAEGQDPDELDEPAPQLTIIEGSPKSP